MTIDVYKRQVLKENKPEDKKTGKDTASKKVHSSIYKEQKKKLKKDCLLYTSGNDTNKFKSLFIQSCNLLQTI